jgi:hypothetical protein
MLALLKILPTILTVINNPAVQSLLPLLSKVGTATFPDIRDPNKAAEAAASLFDPENIKWVQTVLNLAQGENLEVDGEPGEATQAAIKKFQQTNRLEVDGWPGTKTNDALRALLVKKPETI